MRGKGGLFLFATVGLGALLMTSSLEAHRVWRNNPFKMKVAIDDSLLRNELSSMVTRSKESVDLELEGIWQVDGEYKAMVSREIVKKGSLIRGFVVREISRSNVVLASKKDHRKVELWLHEE